MAQKFYASPRETFTFANNAVGHRSGTRFDCLGPYAKVRQCPVTFQAADGRASLIRRYTCYATGYADTAFSLPAATRVRGKHVGGYFAMDDGAIEFRVLDRYLPMVQS